MKRNELVCILDYGSGNVRSVFNMMQSLGANVVISNEVDRIRDASHIILPGVGAFGAAMQRIQERIPIDSVESEVLHGGKPFLGICVGMQVLADRGHEFGLHSGLGWIAGEVSELQSRDLPLPHVGWNDLSVRAESPLLKDATEYDYYFVHSFAFRPQAPEGIISVTDYGESFVSSIQRDNIFAVQFHPEKSQNAGKKLLQNFLQIH